MDKGIGVPKAALCVPRVAWPTLGLFSGSIGAWFWAVSATVSGEMSWLFGAAIATLALHGLFTVMHDASHGSLGRARWLNALIGRLCGSAFLRAFVGFRFVHRQHHKHTNDARRDPDTWSGQGPPWQLPLRWLTQDVVYRRFYRAHWRSRPRRERLELVLLSTLEYAGVAALVWAGYGWEVLCLWLLPAKLTLGLLAFTFDYLPHRPHRVSASEDRYKTTSVRPSALLALLTCYQNLHGVHHLYPAAPFYRYGQIWEAAGPQLTARGMVVRGARAPGGHATSAPGFEGSAATPELVGL